MTSVEIKLTHLFMDYIIRKKEIEAMEGLAKTHFLNENAQRINKSLGDLAGLKNLGFHIIEVLPGYESTEYHSHSCEDECVYILSGNATVTIDETDYEVDAGDFIGYPAGGFAPHHEKYWLRSFALYCCWSKVSSRCWRFPQIR